MPTLPLFHVGAVSPGPSVYTMMYAFPADKKANFQGANRTVRWRLSECPTVLKELSSEKVCSVSPRSTVVLWGPSAVFSWTPSAVDRGKDVTHYLKVV